MLEHGLPRDGHGHRAASSTPRRAPPPRPRSPPAEAEFERLEAPLSRFRPESELSRLNREGAIDAGPDLARVVALALEARERTGGRFDPTLHDALVAAGLRPHVRRAPPGRPRRRTPPPRGGAVHLDGGRIELEPGVRLDLGGIGKGYAAERTAELLASAGPCLVDAGGDIALRGVPAAGLWPVGVGALTLGLERGGVATSGRDRRRWRRGGAEQHHLIDPRTGDAVRLRPAARHRRRGRRGRGRGVGEGAVPRRLRGGARRGGGARPDGAARPRRRRDAGTGALA